MGHAKHRLHAAAGPGKTWSTRLVVSVGVVAALQSCYLAVLSLAALRRVVVPPNLTAVPESEPELVVLVPAHDEQALIERCLGSLYAQRYPVDRYRVVVVADNCTDRTPDLAAAAGADVLVRSSSGAGGKGAALRWAMDQLLATTGALDAFVVVDADSIADPGLLRGLAAELQRGAEAVQGDYLALPEQGTRAELRGAAFLLFHRVRFTGRSVLGLPCSLVGNGMLLSRELVVRYPWNALSATEDLEYSIDLRLLGVRPAFARDARLRAPVSTAGQGARTQRLRWEGGRIHVVRTRLPALLRGCLHGRGRELWDAALDLSVPPLGVLTPAVAGGSAAAALTFRLGAAGPLVLIPWGLAFVALPLHVLVGLLAGGAPRSTFRALLSAPGLVASELVTRTRLLRGTGADTWQRTERAAGREP